MERVIPEHKKGLDFNAKKAFLFRLIREQKGIDRYYLKGDELPASS